jgi:hypothetical protein
MAGVGRAGRRRVAALTAVLLLGAPGCADSHFKPDAEDARRLALLHGDPLAVALAAGTCTDSTAHYRPSSGEPLDFAAVEDNLVRCTRPAASRDEILAVLAAGEAAGWKPSVEDAPGGNLRFRKRFGKVWASAEISASLGVVVDITMPPHTSAGLPPTPADEALGRACVDAARAGRPTMPDCALLGS